MKRTVNVLSKLNWGTRACAVLVLCATTAIALPAQIATLTTIHRFCSQSGCPDGANPSAGLVQATNGDLYGTTDSGGTGNGGTIFKIAPGGTLTTLYSFCSQTNCTDGFYPYGGLVQAANGDLYGTTQYGGTNNYGTIFKITPGGTLTTLYTFCSQTCADGAEPFAGLVQAANGDLYGTTIGGGANGNDGTVFKITQGGTLTTLYSFCSQTNCTDGDQPVAGLVQAANGDLYGTTIGGGANDDGTIFKITPGGTLTTLYSFCSQTNCTDGAYPYAGLVQAANGDLYGTTNYGGVNGDFGTVFKITPTGTLTTLYRFCSQTNCTDGEGPYAGLVQAANGDFYGTTEYGGTNGEYGGTVFKITPSGALTTLYSFCSQTNCADGTEPKAGLVQAADGEFYGTTFSGGANGYGGTVFKITPSGSLTTLYSFCSQGGTSCTDGEAPYAGLVQDTNGDFYGTTYGGANNGGTVFRLSVGLGPFVKPRPPYGKVGAAVKILGTNLTGATSVSFNGTVAVFEVVSSSKIPTPVPAGASSGKVQVITPSGTLSSNASFLVVP